MVFDLSDILFSVIIFVVLFCHYFFWERSYFKRKNVKSLPYYIPFLGHLWRNVFRMEHFKETIDRQYKAFPDQRYVGYRQLTSPIIIIRDLELLKQIAVKDFDYFQDRKTFIDESIDPIFGGNLVSLKGQKWRDMRSTLSPMFTSSKMRGMFELVEQCALQTVDYFNKELKMGKENVFEVEVRDVFCRYANDVIASTAFGLKLNSLVDTDNFFYKIGREAMDFSGIRLVKFMMTTSVPKLFNALRLSIATETMRNFYRKLIKDAMDYRVENNIFRPDMVHLLMEAKKGSLTSEDTGEDKDINNSSFLTVEESSVGKQAVKRKWTDDEIVAQAVLFILAGFETSAGLISFIVYELTVNPETQKKLQKEIDDVATNNNDKLTYRNLHSMEYLDMVITETLRKWPPFVFTDRKCVKPYELPPPDYDSEKGYELKVGDGVQIPIYSIHYDPQYYPDPEKFDPERFSPQRKKEINPYSYLPFGLGPRNCIGSRFALIETKVIVYYLFRNFDFVPIKMTDIPLKVKNDTFNLIAEKGFWIGLKHRTK